MGECPRDFLFERLEETRRDDEHHHPQPVQRVVLHLGELAERHDLERVRGQARDEEPGADGVRSFRDGPAGCVDEALSACCHVVWS
jgi:hypothetical protein